MNLVFRAPCASFPYRDPVLVQMALGGEGRGVLLIQQLLSPLYMPGTVLGARGTAVNKTRSLPCGANISCGGRETDNVGVSKTISEWCVLWWIKTPFEPGGPSLPIKSCFRKRLWRYFTLARVLISRDSAFHLHRRLPPECLQVHFSCGGQQLQWCSPS